MSLDVCVSARTASQLQGRLQTQKENQTQTLRLKASVYKYVKLSCGSDEAVEGQTDQTDGFGFSSFFMCFREDKQDKEQDLLPTSQSFIYYHAGDIPGCDKANNFYVTDFNSLKNILAESSAGAVKTSDDGMADRHTGSACTITSTRKSTSASNNEITSKAGDELTVGQSQVNISPPATAITPTPTPLTETPAAQTSSDESGSHRLLLASNSAHYPDTVSLLKGEAVEASDEDRINQHQHNESNTNSETASNGGDELSGRQSQVNISPPPTALTPTPTAETPSTLTATPTTAENTKIVFTPASASASESSSPEAGSLFETFSIEELRELISVTISEQSEQIKGILSSDDKDEKVQITVRYNNEDLIFIYDSQSDKLIYSGQEESLSLLAQELADSISVSGIIQPGSPNEATQVNSESLEKISGFVRDEGSSDNLVMKTGAQSYTVNVNDHQFIRGITECFENKGETFPSEASKRVQAIIKFFEKNNSNEIFKVAGTY